MMAIGDVSRRAANLHALLVVAERLEGELEGRTAKAKLQADLNKVFIKVAKEGVTFQAKGKTSWLGRMLEGKTAFSIQDSAKIIFELFRKIEGSSREDLANALDELHEKRLDVQVKDATGALLLFIDRWNAIITHVGQKKENVQAMNQYKIHWSPSQKVRFADVFAEKVFNKEVLLPHRSARGIKKSLARKPSRSILRKVQANGTAYWLKATMPSLKSIERFRKIDADTLRLIVYKLCRDEMARTARTGAKSERNKERAIATLKEFSKKELERLVEMAKDKQFVAELKSLDITSAAIKQVQKKLTTLLNAV